MHPTRSRSDLRHPGFWLTLALALCLAAPAAAYTIYLKDGSRIVSRDKYRVEGDRALIVLENGTQTFIKASEIDVPRTDKANAGANYGTAYELEGVREVPAPRTQTERKESLDDLIRAGKANPTDRPTTRRQEVAPAGPSRGRTASGDADYSVLPRGTLADGGLAEELAAFLTSQGIQDVVVQRGTAADRALISARTDSEGAVFRALAASAVLLTETRKKSPSRLGSIQLLLRTASGEKAGQFEMTPELAERLLGKTLELSQFYVDQLQF
jgi:hypothetical protein